MPSLSWAHNCLCCGRAGGSERHSLVRSGWKLDLPLPPFTCPYLYSLLINISSHPKIKRKRSRKQPRKYPPRSVQPLLHFRSLSESSWRRLGYIQGRSVRPLSHSRGLGDSPSGLPLGLPLGLSLGLPFGLPLGLSLWLPLPLELSLGLPLGLPLELAPGIPLGLCPGFSPGLALGLAMGLLNLPNPCDPCRTFVA